MEKMLLSVICSVVLAGSSVALQPRDIPAIPENGELWVVLVAGSNGWFNYRHQADVCHAYQIVSAHGIPDDHIIVMMYDDLANNPENPTPGKIINHPNGTDVYHGVPKDYTCNQVRPDIFLKVLAGETINEGSGKTLKSTKNDHVFVYFADHGAKGILGFGQAMLKATDLQKTIQQMHQKNMYSKLVFYVEACESGSMFQGLLDPKINVFATTASNATTSSYACYYDPERKTFLGDVYSIKWLEDSDASNIEKETLEEQYKRVKKETNTSTVCQFGDMSISKMTVGSFQGEKEDVEVNPPPVPPQWLSCGRTAVPGPQVPLAIQTHIINESTDSAQVQEAREKYDKMKKNRQYMEYKTRSIVQTVLQTDDQETVNNIFIQNLVLTQYDCYYAAVDAFHEHCFNVGQNDYALRMLNVFVNLCHMNPDHQPIVEAIQMTCDHPAVHGIY